MRFNPYRDGFPVLHPLDLGPGGVEVADELDGPVGESRHSVLLELLGEVVLRISICKRALGRSKIMIHDRAASSYQ